MNDSPFWSHEFELTLATGPGDPTKTVHLLMFNDPSDIDTWDVANCGTSLGDWDAFDVLREGPISSVALCKTCFTEGLRP